MQVTNQLYKTCKIIFKVLDQEKVCHYLPGDMGGGGIMKGVTKSDIAGRRV